MDLTPKQQTSEAIRQADNILIVAGVNPTVDQIVAVSGLAAILRKFGKKTSAVISEQLPSKLSFLELPAPDKNLQGLRDFILKVDVRKSEVDKLKYTVEDEKLNIHITPFKGGFAPSDVTFAYGSFHFDIIIVLGVASRNRIDRVFDKTPDMLDNTPIINIDFHRINENYGAVNLIDPNAASLCEILVALSESLQTGLIDEPIATALLTGIMASTDRFTAQHTTAKALTVAAQLMAAGAKQQAVVRALYKGGEGAQRREPSGSGQRRSEPKPAAKPTPRPESDDVPAAETAEEPSSAGSVLSDL